jgi:hypothetical protein
MIRLLYQPKKSGNYKPEIRATMLKRKIMPPGHYPPPAATFRRPASIVATGVVPMFTSHEVITSKSKDLRCLVHPTAAGRTQSDPAEHLYSPSLNAPKCYMEVPTENLSSRPHSPAPHFNFASGAVSFFIRRS